MRKQNNKYRNNNNNNNYNPAYSLNYRFDSNSPAGKYSGTALDLIKRYNELAKDALNSQDYVTAEIFRQYAEHYRKIVTDINEKKNNYYNNKKQAEENNQAEEVKTEQPQAEAPKAETPKKEFKVIEIADAKTETPPKPKRTYRKKAIAAE